MRETHIFIGQEQYKNMVYKTQDGHKIQSFMRVSIGSWNPETNMTTCRACNLIFINESIRDK